MSPSICISIVVLILVVLAILVAVTMVKGMSVQRERALRNRFPNAKLVVSSANFFGQESSGVMQLRGNGTMLVTDSELIFEMWLPRREFRIPLASIQAIETPSSFLGKSYFRPLLKVVFRTDTGQTDSMAWYLPNLDEVKGSLEQA